MVEDLQGQILPLGRPIHIWGCNMELNIIEIMCEVVEFINPLKPRGCYIYH
jgi:hypothetical protein